VYLLFHLVYIQVDVWQLKGYPQIFRLMIHILNENILRLFSRDSPFNLKRKTSNPKLKTVFTP